MNGGFRIALPIVVMLGTLVLCAIYGGQLIVDGFIAKSITFGLATWVAVFTALVVWIKAGKSK